MWIFLLFATAMGASTLGVRRVAAEASPPAQAAPEEPEPPESIHFVITGAKSQKGSVLCGLYDRESTWLGRDYLQGAKAEVDARGTARCIFRDVPAGSYAISAFHDVDDDNELDRKIFGIPSEPYCASRNARRAFGPPRWRDAVFEYQGSGVLELVAKF